MAEKALEQIVNAPLKVEETPLEVEQVFMTYAGCCGDVQKTAKACGISMQRVIEYAETGNWLERIRELIDLKEIGKFDDVSRAISRATNFVQANRFRMYIERVVRKLSEVSDDELLDEFTTKRVTKDGQVVVTGLSLRMLADIGSAMEKVHWMTYMALCDGTPERAARKAEEKPDDVGGDSDMHAKIARTLAAMKLKTIDQQVEEANATVVQAPLPTPAQ